MLYRFGKTISNPISALILCKDPVCSFSAYLVSLSMSVITTLQLREYLNKITLDDKKSMPKYINLDLWEKYEYVGWLIVSMGVIMAFLGLKKYIMMLVNLFL